MMMMIRKTTNASGEPRPRRSGLRRTTLPLLLAALSCLALAATLFAQDIITSIIGTGGKPALAVIDFRGAGAQQYMSAFNSTLFGDLLGSGLFDMKPKSVYPLNNPQRPEDLRVSDAGQGFALPDWNGTPVNASHLVFGYTAAQNGALVLYGYVDDTRQANPQNAQLMASRYVGSLDEAGAIHVAHEFASDIIQKFGGTASLLGSRIYFSSKRSGSDEIWAMDWDGNNQTQLTSLKSLSLYPAVSPDGSRVAFTSWAKGTPRIMMVDTITRRQVQFYNQEASVNANASFTPDGKHIFYASSASGIEQIYTASVDGQGFRRVSHQDTIQAEPKVNPKNPGLLLYVAGQPHPQIYQMSAEGVGVERVTNGSGEATNPSWHPDGQHFAFSWTSGIAAGNFNVFVMDIGSRQYVQLTHGEGRNENPVWAPDGRHLVFMSDRSGKYQIYTMLADGTQLKQLTNQGVNRYPVWGVR
jgi:TolB protein